MSSLAALLVTQVIGPPIKHGFLLRETTFEATHDPREDTYLLSVPIDPKGERRKIEEGKFIVRFMYNDKDGGLTRPIVIATFGSKTFYSSAPPLKGTAAAVFGNNALDRIGSAQASIVSGRLKVVVPRSPLGTSELSYAQIFAGIASERDSYAQFGLGISHTFYRSEADFPTKGRWQTISPPLYWSPTSGIGAEPASRKILP